MDDYRANQIAQLRQSIKSLEDTQRMTGIDLLSSIAIQQRLLTQLEQESIQPVVIQNGGVNAAADQLVIGGDVAGRDKIESKVQNIMADGHVLINSTLIIYTSGNPAFAQAQLAKYLHHISMLYAPLKLAAIDQDAAKPGTRPLGLTSIYVNLNLDLRIPTHLSLSDYLVRDQQPLHSQLGEGEAEPRETRMVPVMEAMEHCPQLVLLGKPGSGKSTLSVYLALTLAEAGLGVSGAIDRLGEAWTHGPLLPIRVILRQFAASLPHDLKRGRAHHLWTYIQEDVNGYGIYDDLGTLLHNVANQSGALFLLDGLDEVGDDQHRKLVLEAVTELMSTAGGQCRFLVTARPYAWEDVEQRIAQARYVYRLADFEQDQIDLFIVRWYDVLFAQGWVGDKRTSYSKTRELQEATRRNDLQALVANPLLLMLIVILHSNRTTRLGNDRVDVYDEVVKLLLERWHQSEDNERSSLEVLGITLWQVRGRIEGLAFEAHSENMSGSETTDIDEATLTAAFRPLVGNSHDKAQQIIQYIERRTGLLVGQGVRRHQQLFTFPHRVFQEYLAACYLARQRDFEKRANELVMTMPDHWREVVVLAARIAGIDRAVGVADALIHRQRYDEYRRTHLLSDNDWRAAILAALQLIEVGLQDILADDAYRPVCERVIDWLLRLVETPQLLSLTERIEAANLLGQLGDPRFELIYAKGQLHYILPPLAHIAAGPFEMGSNKGETKWDDEYTKVTKNRRHVIDVPEFWISRYPVTNAEYRLFVAATGTPPPSHWRDGEVPAALATHPVVNISWYNARAYCQWLSEVSGRNVRLPTEAEWEKSARWDAVQKQSHLYPWGDKWDATRCNTSESGLGTTTPVGIYPDGASPSGVLDAAGNVWEWTLSKFKEYPYQSNDGRNEIDRSEGTRVVHGGSWHSYQIHARCACRGIRHPGYHYANYGFRCCFPSGNHT